MKGILKEIMADVGAEMKHQVEAGAHELASAIFRGSDGFVMYPHAGKEAEAHGVEAPQQEAPQHGLPPEAVKQVEAPQQERGMEMEM